MVKKLLPAGTLQLVEAFMIAPSQISFQTRPSCSPISLASLLGHRLENRHKFSSCWKLSMERSMLLLFDAGFSKSKPSVTRMSLLPGFRNRVLTMLL
jgi:hypothetical protein